MRTNIISSIFHLIKGSRETTLSDFLKKNRIQKEGRKQRKIGEAKQNEIDEYKPIYKTIK